MTSTGYSHRSRTEIAGGELPLSFAQQRQWLLDQLMPQSPAYNIPAAVRLKGSFEVTALEQALNEIVRRHETYGPLLLWWQGSRCKSSARPNRLHYR